MGFKGILDIPEHIFTCVGNFSAAVKLLHKINFPKELIVYNDIDYLMRYIQ